MHDARNDHDYEPPQLLVIGAFQDLTRSKKDSEADYQGASEGYGFPSDFNPFGRNAQNGR